MVKRARFLATPTKASWFPGWESTLCLAVLVLAAYLRLANVADNPGWYADEGTHLEIARNILRGRTQYLAVTDSTLLFGRVPLFEQLLAACLAAFGTSMATLRTFTGVLGTASVAMLYAVIRRASGDTRLALLSSLALTLYPNAVLYSRFGFSYGLLTPFVLIAFWGLCEFWSNGRVSWLLLSSLAVGLGLLSDLLMGVFIPVVLIVGLAKRPRHLALALPSTVAPWALYAAVELGHSPEAFQFDLAYTLSRLDGGALPDQVLTLAENYSTMLTQDSWWALGLLGLFLLQPAHLRILSLLFLFIPIFLVGRSLALHGLSYYYLIPLLPFSALGLAALARFGLPQAIKKLTGNSSHGRVQAGERAQWLATAVIVLVAGIPIAFTTWLSFQRVQIGYPTAIDPFLVDGADARIVAAFVNDYAQDEDVVIASPAVAWLVDTNVADFQMAVAATGVATPHLPADLPRTRFAFDPRYEEARLIIVDNLWHTWAAFHVPGTRALLELAEATWPLIYAVGDLRVYENPHPG